MAEVTGNPPVEYRNVGVETAQSQSAGWQQTQVSATIPDEGVSIARQLVAEFIGTFALVFIAVSATYWWYPDYIVMGLASGVTVAVLVIAFTQLGSGQFNPAITLGLLLGGKLKFTRALFIVLTQIFAAVLACLILSSFLGVNEKSNWIVKNPVDEATGQQTSTMLEPVGTATPTIPERIGFKDPQMKDIEPGKAYPTGSFRQYQVPESQRVSTLQAIVLEAMLTFFWGLAVFAGWRQRNRVATGLMVGGAVFVGIVACAIMTGAAMNPVRAFGPALVSGTWDFQMVYWIGPLLGGALAGVVCGHLLFNDDESEEGSELQYPRT
jgi:glycerol uptake facilitator-like aquaporin